MVDVCWIQNCSQHLTEYVFNINDYTLPGLLDIPLHLGVFGRETNNTEKTIQITNAKEKWKNYVSIQRGKLNKLNN